MSCTTGDQWRVLAQELGRPDLADLDDLRRLSGGGKASPHLSAASWAITEDAAQRISEQLVQRLGDFHEANPLRTGESKATVASGLGVEVDVLEAVVGADDRVVEDGATLRLATFTGGWGERQEAAWAAAAGELRADAGHHGGAFEHGRERQQQ